MSVPLSWSHHSQSFLAKEPEDVMPDCDCFFADSLPYAEPMDFAKSLPAIYSLELNPACNNRCTGCSNVFVANRLSQPTLPYSSPLTWREWETVLATIAPHATKLALTGGEATLHPHFSIILARIQHYALPFTLFSNGRWQDPEHIIELLANTSLCNGLLISLHGANAEAHDAFSGVNGSFEETVATIQRSAAAGLRVHTNTVLTRLNSAQIEEMVAFSQSLGAKRAVFNRPIGNMSQSLALPTPLLFQSLRHLEFLASQGMSVKIGSGLPLCTIQNGGTGCVAGISSCTIDPWGNVRPCNHAPQIAGNLFEQTLETIWSSPTMQEWREYLPDDCTRCALLASCHGGCRAEAMLKNMSGDPLIGTCSHEYKG
jgi:radical SAM protein with 4Fe4S-binding SPASM domain